MKRRPQIDSEALMRDIARYLAAIEVFRAHDCERTWRPTAMHPPAPGALLREGRHAPAAH
jgi:hypothetical protein